MRLTRRTIGQGSSNRSHTVGLAILSRHYREALAQTLRGPRLLVEDLGDGPVEKLLEQLLDLRPDVALVDLPSTDATVLIRETYRSAPAIRMIALNQGGDEHDAVSLFETGVTGYLHRSSSIEDVRVAIRDGLVGEFHCPPRITAALVRRLNEVGVRRGSLKRCTSVSPKEAQVLPLLELSLTNKEIAQRLGVEESTIKNHVHNILRKFGVHQRSEAVRRYRSEEPRIQVVRRSPKAPGQSGGV